MSTKTTTTDTTINTTNTNTTNTTNHPSLLRIACLIPSATIICIELGLYDNIVGVTHECIEFLLLPQQPNNNNNNNNNNIRILTRDGLPSNSTQNEIHNAIIKQSQQSQDHCSRTTSTTANNVLPSLYPLIQEEIHKAQPTLIITQDLCNVCAPTSNQIKDIIIKDKDSSSSSNDPKNPQIISLSPKTLKDVANTFVTIADACGIKNVGITKRNEWLNKFEKLQTTIEKNIHIDDDNNNNSNKPTSSSSRKKMLILEWLDPPFDSGHWTYDMMDCIKVDNAAAVTAVIASANNNAKNKATNKATQHKKSIQITWDDIYKKMKPTVVIVGCCGFNLQRNYEDAMKYKLELSKLQHAAARNGNIYAVNGNMYIAMPSPYLLEGTIVLALCAYQDQPSVIQAIHAEFPEYFEESSSTTTTTKLQWKSIDLLFQQNDEEEQSSTLITGKTSAVNKSSNSNGNNNNATSSLPDIEDIIGAESSTDVIPKDIIGFGQLHMDACKQGLDKYIDPISGYSVFTELAHKKRGYCCGSGCRHCPFGHENIKMESKSTTIQQPSILYMAKTKTKTSTGGKGQGQDDDDDDCDELFSLQQHPNITKILFFSGGKDSFLTIRQLVKDYYNCSKKSNNKFGLVLLTTFDSTTRIIAHQNVHIDQVIKQAQHLNITLVGVPLRRGSGELYVDRIEKGINIIKDKLLLSESKNNTNTNTNTNNSVLGDHNDHNHNHHNSIVLVAGDLHLEHIRNWRETTFGNNNNNKQQQQQYNNKYKLEFPLWKMDYDKLMDDLELSQVPCQISAVTINNDNDDDDDDSLFEIKQQLKVGTIFTRELYNQLVLLKSKTTNNNIDGFGEKGEFHSLAMVWKIPRETCLGLLK